MYLANKLSYSETLSQTPDLDNFATAYRSLKRVINLAPQMDADGVINWTIVGLSWQYLRAPTLDGSLSQWSSSCVYSTFPSREFISESWYFHRTDSVETGGWLVAQPGGLRSEVLNDYALYKSTHALTHSNVGLCPASASSWFIWPTLVWYCEFYECNVQGRRRGFESRGTNSARSARRIFFQPPTFWPVGGGQNIA